MQRRHGGFVRRSKFAKYRQSHTAQYPYTINPFSKHDFNVCDTFVNDMLDAGLVK
jgi:hypothetical protein